MKDPDDRIARWVLKLLHYNFDFIHHARAAHLNTVGLSQLPICCFNLTKMESQFELLLLSKYPGDLYPNKQKVIQCLKNTKVKDSKLFNLVKDQYLPIFNPVIN